jgi:hypothetical protein
VAQRNAIECNATESDATQRKATQRNAMQRNATHGAFYFFMLAHLQLESTSTVITCNDNEMKGKPC